MQDKIIAAIAEKIKDLPIDDEGRYSTWFPDDLATEIAAAIAPLLPGFRDLQIGTKVEVIAKLDHGDDPGHYFDIGRVGKITSIDEDDDDLCYKVDGVWWVSRGEINPIP